MYVEEVRPLGHDDSGFIKPGTERDAEVDDEKPNKEMPKIRLHTTFNVEAERLCDFILSPTNELQQAESMTKRIAQHCEPTPSK
jgi:hypothetical protein